MAQVRVRREGTGEQTMTIVKGLFLEGEKITVKVGNDLIVRKVWYNRADGLYFMYQNKKYFEYEF